MLPLHHSSSRVVCVHVRKLVSPSPRDTYDQTFHGQSHNKHRLWLQQLFDGSQKANFFSGTNLMFTWSAKLFHEEQEEKNMRYSKLVHQTWVMCVIKCALGQNCRNWRILFVLNTTFCERIWSQKKTRKSRRFRGSRKVPSRIARLTGW